MRRDRSIAAAVALLAIVLVAAAAVVPAQGTMPPERLSVDAGSQPLTVWSRRPEHPQAAIVLVHGRTWSARPDFDFASHSRDRSTLRALAARGFATYALDLPGYGASPRDPSGWLSPSRAAEDVEAVLRVVAQRHPTLPAPVLFGWSRGSKISALVATRGKVPLGALVLYGYNLDPRAPPDNGAAAGQAPARRNTAEAARSDFVSPEVADAQLIADFVSAALATDPVRADVCCDSEFAAIRPESIRTPTLLIHGARDPAFKPTVAADFFSRLGAPERRWIIIGRGDHAAHLEDTAPEFLDAVSDFLHWRAGVEWP